MGKIGVQAIPGGGLSKSDFRLRAAYSLNVELDQNKTSEPANSKTITFTMRSPFGISEVANPTGVIPKLEGVTWGIQDLCLKGVYTPKTIRSFEYNYGSGTTELMNYVDSDTPFPYNTLLQDSLGQNLCYAKVASFGLVRIDGSGCPVVSVTGKFWTNTGEIGRGEIRVILEFALK